MPSFLQTVTGTIITGALLVVGFVVVPIGEAVSVSPVPYYGCEAFSSAKENSAPEIADLLAQHPGATVVTCLTNHRDQGGEQHRLWRLMQPLERGASGLCRTLERNVYRVKSDAGLHWSFERPSAFAVSQEIKGRGYPYSYYLPDEAGCPPVQDERYIGVNNVQEDEFVAVTAAWNGATSGHDKWKAFFTRYLPPESRAFYICALSPDRVNSIVTENISAGRHGFPVRFVERPRSSDPEISLHAREFPIQFVVFLTATGELNLKSVRCS